MYKVNVKDCPCHSGVVYSECCASFHNKESFPDTALQLMRSRYSAYSLRLIDYLIDTTHKDKLRPSYRSKLLATIHLLDWIDLKIVKTSLGEADHKSGKVEFEATYIENGKSEVLVENSRFKKHIGKWFYYDGKG